MKRDWDKAFAETPELFHRKLEDTLCEIEEGRCVKKRYKVGTLVLAALLVLALAGGIAVAGETIFGWASGLFASDELSEHFSKLNELADTEVQTALSEDGKYTMEIVQSYYDGDIMCIGYKLYGDYVAGHTVPDFKADDELVARIKSRAKVDKLNRMSDLSDDAVAAISALDGRDITVDESACVAVYSAYLGDHSFATVNGEVRDISADMEHFEIKDGAMVGYREYKADAGSESGLPPASDDVTELIYEPTLKTSVQYFYKDASGAYIFTEQLDSEQMKFTIKRIKGD